MLGIHEPPNDLNFRSEWAVWITQESGKTPLFPRCALPEGIPTPFFGVLQQLYPSMRGDLSLEK